MLWLCCRLFVPSVSLLHGHCFTLPAEQALFLHYSIQCGQSGDYCSNNYDCCSSQCYNQRCSGGGGNVSTFTLHSWRIRIIQIKNNNNNKKTKNKTRMSREDVCKLRSRIRVCGAKQKNKKSFLGCFLFVSPTIKIFFSFPSASIEHFLLNITVLYFAFLHSLL